MSSISQFFGGEQKVSPSAGFMKNPTYLNNTEISNPQSVGNDRAYITPIDDQYFYILSSGGGANHGYYAQIFELNGDSTVSSVASINIGNREVRAFTCSGTNALTTSWNGSRPIVDKLVWNGSSTITKTQLSDTIARSINDRSHVGTALNDGRLLLAVPQFGSTSRYIHYFQMDTDGTTGQVINKSTQFRQTDGSTYATSCGTGDGIYIAGRREAGVNRLNGMKIYPRLDSTSTPDSGEAYSETSSNGDFIYFSILPMAQGGVVGTMMTSDATNSTGSHRLYFTMASYNPVQFLNTPSTNGNGNTFGNSYIPYPSESHGDIEYPVHRCANGSYQDADFKVLFIDDSNNLFPVAKNSFYSMRRTVGANSSLSTSSSAASTCLMGNRVLVLLKDTTNFKFNVNVWRLA